MLDRADGFVPHCLMKFDPKDDNDRLIGFIIRCRVGYHAMLDAVNNRMQHLTDADRRYVITFLQDKYYLDLPDREKQVYE
jgi:hypothetical protein